ncbi:DUF4231 domain-containing protein [Tunturibacter psychrotolerans]|uniref:DUF4231 domain-containing protein n=1 Tax=Tunturiibacter psychrotolerans TaxID=3069686 RepID=A0AAU7ZPW6_9BACT
MTLPQLIELQALDTIQTAAAKVPLSWDSIIVLLGTLDQPIAAQVRSICARSIAPMAARTKALIVDDGIDSGLSLLMGQAAAEVDQSPNLLGILDYEIEGFDRNHSFVVRLPAEWLDSAKAKFQLTVELAKGDPASGIGKVNSEKVVLAILFGGGETERKALLRCTRRSWPIVLVQGSGGLADSILNARTPPIDGIQKPPVNDPELREILEIGVIYPIPIEDSVDDLNRILLRLIKEPLDTLTDAWGRYDALDTAAIEKQRQFRTIQKAILSLGIIATALAIVSAGGFVPDSLRQHVPVATKVWIAQYLHSSTLHQVVHVLLILAPIVISILVSFNSRFREGNKWVLLRGSAEALKREIFRYQARAGIYSDQKSGENSAESILAAKIKDISGNLAQSEVNRSCIDPRAIAKETGRTFITPEEYLNERVRDQIKYFENKTATLYSQLKRLHLYILLAGGLGTFLAAIKLDVWVALTVALATAFTTKLEMFQVENSLIQYNIALTSLRNIASWWKALSPWEKGRRTNIDLLVEQTEKTSESETTGWVQQMQSTLDKLTEKESTPDKGSTRLQKT